jgi:hypothetical protein
MSSPPLGGSLFQLNQVNGKRRLSQHRSWRAHISRCRAELAQFFIGHPAEPLSKLIDVEIQDLDAGLHPTNFTGIALIRLPELLDTEKVRYRDSQ